MYRLKSSEIEF